MARPPAATDALLAVALGAEMQVELLLADGPANDLLIAHVALLALAGAVAARRRWPVAAAALAVLVSIVMERLDPQLSEHLVGPFFATLIVAFSVGAHAEGRQLAAGVAVLVLGSAVAIRLDEPPGGAEDFLFAGTIIVAGPLLLGRLMHSRAALGEALRAKAAAAEDERDARAADAVSGERARIAGELHHLVNGALTTMVGQAASAEQLARGRPEVAEQAFAAVEETGREALAEIRGLLGVLRHADESLALAPQPSLEHLADLVARVRAAGLPVELAVEGERAPLPAGVDLTAYRVVQEALAGAQHAPAPRQAAVRVRYAPGQLALAVTDTGETPAGERPLLGMRERVALYGGDLVAEPAAAGYAVRATLPLERSQ